MAGTSLFALLDDIATVLDDIAVLTKVAAKKTAGVLGDDLALNAQQVAGVASDRELPVVWAVAKGSLVNKAILVPAALAISAFTPWGVIPLLMVGGTYLCFEGVEKLHHKLFHSKAESAHDEELIEAISLPEVDLMAFERDKVKGAIRTDFVLSAEIIVISLGTVAEKPLLDQFFVLVLIALVMTLGVYGFVAAIVKLDDLGLWMSLRRGSRASRIVGQGLLRTAPLLLKTLSVAGTVAMFLVGGGILVHGIHPLGRWMETLPGIVHPLVTGLTGIAAGILALTAALAVSSLWKRLR